MSGESHGQRSLAGYSPHGHKEPHMTEQHTHTHTHTHTHPSKLELPVLTGKVDLLLMSPDFTVFLFQILFSRFVTGEGVNNGSKISLHLVKDES